MIRTWSAEDDCGNAMSASQTIIVKDSTPPVLVNIPVDVTADCDGGNIPSVPTVTATDNCDANVNVIFTETTIDGNCRRISTLITDRTATDNCGNAATGQQTISLGDTTPPILIGVPTGYHR
ncbi:MAG: hypothetical protein IPJ06_05390 [Saprospiraceae bacterium]|nr:hypothetical protein [Saprospiraceae bacterium]